MKPTCINCEREGLSDLANIGKCLPVRPLNVNVTNLVQLGINPVQPVHAVKGKLKAVTQRAEWSAVHTTVLFFKMPENC